MTFFPFGIPSISSFAENVQYAEQRHVLSGTIGYALTASRGLRGSNAVEPTGCPEGFFDAVNPPDPLDPVQSNPLVDRTKYILCAENPSSPPPPPLGGGLSEETIEMNVWWLS